MKGIRSIVFDLFITLLTINNCIAASQNQPNSSSRYTITADGDESIQVTLIFPEYFGTYAEVFGRTNLLEGQWQVIDSWLPTYGNSALIWDDILRTNANAFFYMIHDATLDVDGDGYSDWREHYISETDPESFDYADVDGDGLHDYWEIKLFGDVWTQDGYDDSDGDGLPNNQELVWRADNIIQMVSDPTLYDTDGEGLDDFTERQKKTDPLSVDTDSDGRDDASEVLGSPPTDPNNSDIVAPVLVLAGG